MLPTLDGWGLMSKLAKLKTQEHSVASVELASNQLLNDPPYIQPVIQTRRHGSILDVQVRLLKAVADDVACLVLLQPRKGLPCALCVANTQFHTTDATPTPHLVQASLAHLKDLVLCLV